MSQLQNGGASLVSYVLPWWRNPALGRITTHFYPATPSKWADNNTNTLYVGWSLIALAAVGAVLVIRRHRRNDANGDAPLLPRLLAHPRPGGVRLLAQTQDVHPRHRRADAGVLRRPCDHVLADLRPVRCLGHVRMRDARRARPHRRRRSLRWGRLVAHGRLRLDRARVHRRVPATSICFSPPPAWAIVAPRTTGRDRRELSDADGQASGARACCSTATSSRSTRTSRSSPCSARATATPGRTRSGFSRVT